MVCFGLSDVDFDPSKVARDTRKAHIAKNEQHLKNLARSQHGLATTTKTPGTLSERKGETERTLAMTRGVKRKVKRVSHKYHDLLSSFLLV